MAPLEWRPSSRQTTRDDAFCLAWIRLSLKLQNSSIAIDDLFNNNIVVSIVVVSDAIAVSVSDTSHCSLLIERKKRRIASISVSKFETRGPKKFFAHCAVSGLLASGASHFLLTPVDVIKCNLQMRPLSTSTVSGVVASTSSLSSLWRGWSPTLLGYSLHGAVKFGLYEEFKFLLQRAVGRDNARKYRDIVYLTSSATAEFVACAVLSPFEALKVRLQTSHNFARGVGDGLPKMARLEGVSSMYTGLLALWARQLPLTLINFMSFERVASFIYDILPVPKEHMSRPEHLGVVLASGIVSGLFCGAVSHPADVLVTRINAEKRPGNVVQKTLVIVDEIGLRGLTKGFTPRVFMIGALTAIQWLVYGTYKAAVGLPTPGSGGGH
jgi:solute carrier family 25 phosphate transporter 3